MSTIELKKKVIEKIEGLKEDHLLEEVLALLEFETNPIPVALTKAQKKAVDEGKEQIKNGEYHTNEEVDKEIDKWLKG